MKKRLFFVLTITFVLVFLFVSFYLVEANNQTTYSQECSTVQGTVLSKEHKDIEVIREYKQLLFGGNRLIPHVIPEYNNVTIGYESITTTIDSITLYKEVEVGDVVEVTLHQVYDQNNNLVNQYLALPQ